MRALPTSLPAWLVVGGLVLVTAAGTAAITVLLLNPERDPDVGIGHGRSSQPSGTGGQGVDPSSSPRPSVDPGLSSRLVADFDRLPTGSQVDGWIVSAGGRLETTARPTAVDRSVRLDGETQVSACHDLDVEIEHFEATFMLDELPPGDLTVVSVDLEGGSTHGVTVTGESASLTAGGQPVELASGEWYRWAVSGEEDGYRERLMAAGDDTVLAETPSLADATVRATRFCLTAMPPARVYLSSLTVETP